MNSLKNHVDINVLKKIYISLFDSYVRYGLHLWANTSSRNLSYIFKLQKKAIRIICKVPYNAHTNELFKKLNLLKLNQLVEKSYTYIMFKYSKKDLPFNLQAMFISNTNVHTYNTRQHTHPHITKHHTQLYSNSYLHRAPMIWQSLPIQIKNCKTIQSFGRQLNKHYLSEI